MEGKHTYFMVLLVAAQVFNNVSAQAPTLSLSPGEVCPGDEVTFTCTVPAVLRWEFDMEVISAGVADIGTERSLGPFQVTVMNTTDGITSIISTSATGAMDGNLLTCINVGAGGDNSRSVTLDVVQSNLSPPMISDIIDLNTECVLVQLQSQGNTMCLDDYTVEAVGSRTITNTSITADVTICGLDLCNDVLGFEARSNGEELDSMESQTSNETFPSPGSVVGIPTYTPTTIMVEVSWESEESFISGLLDIGVSITTNRPADASCTASFPDNRFRCTPSYSNFLEQTVIFTVLFQLAASGGCMTPRNSTPFSFPLIIAGITEDVTDTRATVTLTYVSGISVTSGFMLVGTVSQGASIVQNVNQAFEMSDTTYEIADNLIRNTSYTYDIRIESGADSSIVIGSATGSFATELTPPPPPEASSVPIWIVAPIVIGVLLLLATGGLVGICIYKRKTKRYSPSDSQQPGPLYEDMSSHEKSRDIALEENVAYGPVTPQQSAAMYEEVSAQPAKIEMSGNVAYGQISH